MARLVFAAVVLIGDELLSGRTQDSNLRTIARFLTPLGVEVREARFVADDREAIVSAVDELRRRYDYVFTTGGIGPTHDDITADAIAAAFGVDIGVRADAMAILEAYYAARGQDVNEGRRRMARIPDGADLIANPVSGAPGFKLGNVFVLAGVPAVMRGMLENVAPLLEGGAIVHSRTVRGRGAREGDIALPLASLAESRPEIDFGSYPFMILSPAGPEFGINLVARSRDPSLLPSAIEQLADILRVAGAEAEIDPATESRT